MNISIIGAGLGGLACGIHLLNQGFKVQIFEKNDRVGGRANQIEENGFKIDMGPTLILMPEILDGLFRSVGRSMADYLRLKRIEPAYRIQFSDGKYFDMTTDISKLVSQVREFEPSKANAFDRYRRDVHDKLESSRHSFIERNFDSIFQMVSWDSFKSFLKIKPWGNAYQHAYHYFKNDYLATAFSCQCLYLGQSPHKTPALYNLLAYLEFTYGIWYPLGGLHEIPKALARLFEEMGGVLRLNSPVDKIVVEEGRCRGLKLKDGSLELSDGVVSNRDLPASFYHFVDASQRRTFSNERIEGLNYGCSAFMVYLGLKRKIKGLFHHNIFLNKDLKQSTAEIFNEGRLPQEPLIYACCPTKTDPSLAPEGKEVLYLLSIVPNLTSKVNWSSDLESFRKKVFERLQKNGVAIQEDDIELERHFTPKDFESTYGSFRGTAFGLAPDFFQSAAFRPAIRSKDVEGLYHVGMSTHPGGGVPMVLTSGRLAAEAVRKDFKGSLEGVSL